MVKLIYCILLTSFVLEMFSQCELDKIVYNESFDMCEDNPWVLVFEDNFEGNSLDLSNWQVVTGVPRDPYFESQKAWHKPENIVVEDGFLKIITKKEELLNQCFDIWLDGKMQNFCSNFNYSTGEIMTKVQFEYGIFQARVKIPKGKGFWPAFWTFSGNPWNEIDIFEFWNENNIWNNYDPEKLSTVHHTNAWYDYDEDGKGNSCSDKYNGQDFSIDFHIFTMIWSPSYIYWYVDGDLKRELFKHYTLEMSPVKCEINDYKKYFYLKTFPADPMSIILNLAIQCGADAHGNDKVPDNSTPFPSQMEVDWVRYYTKKPKQIVNIDSSSQFTFTPDAYNIIVGEEVNINCEFTIPPGQQLEIIGKNGVTLGANFKAENSVLNIKVDPTLYDSNLHGTDN